MHPQTYLFLAASVIRGSPLSRSVSEPVEKRKQVLAWRFVACGELGSVMNWALTRRQWLLLSWLLGPGNGGWASHVSATFEGPFLKVCLGTKASCSRGAWGLEVGSDKGVDMFCDKSTQGHDF